MEVRLQRSAAKAFVEYCDRIFRAQLRILGPEIGRGRKRVVLEYGMVVERNNRLPWALFFFFPYLQAQSSQIFD